MKTYAVFFRRDPSSISFTFISSIDLKEWITFPRTLGDVQFFLGKLTDMRMNGFSVYTVDVYGKDLNLHAKTKYGVTKWFSSSKESI